MRRSRADELRLAMDASYNQEGIFQRIDQYNAFNSKEALLKLFKYAAK